MIRAKIHLLVCGVALLLTTAVLAQSGSLYSYQDLSHFYYSKQRDSLKKAWTCPTSFKDKAAQKKYREIWDQRIDGIIGAINGDDYVHDNEVYTYIDGIVRQITEANRQLVPVKPFVFIDRSSWVNAYAVGGNLLAVNLGLITFSTTREELALAIAHEMSHNILHHVENAMYQKAEWLSSDDYKQSLNAVLDSKYERLSRLKKVLEGYTFSRNRHQRYHESEADSLAIILLKRSNIAFQAGYFLHLDSADLEYEHPLKHSLSAFFTAYHLPYEEGWTQKRSHGLSTRAYSFSDTSKLADSLKTHPDCVDRYAKTRSLTTPNAHLTPIPASIQDRANKMLLWNMYSGVSLTPCLYRILLIKDKGNTDLWYDFMLSNIFAGLYYSDRVLNRFNAIGVVPKEVISRDYYALQTLLEQIPRDNLKQACQTLQNGGFWKNMPSVEKDLKSFVFTLALDPDDSDRNKARAAHLFSTGNANSMYNELAQNFEKK
ncbi:M48 family metalloprotease [Puia sp.]|jgi:Zn-dependent protease with chaperone function|uniref:M48 family metalloprotease n=1 Tax=Puia sp. TaxID=2045100 RepID=UPI002F404E54